jgi:superfamily II DNA or RNA helicase
MRVIDKRGYTFTPDIEQLKRAKQELKFKPELKFEYGAIKKGFVAYNLYDDGSMTVPRAWGIKNIGLAHNRLSDGAEISPDVQMLADFELDKSRCQDVAVAAVQQALNSPPERGGGMGLISLPCGGGKTVLFIYILARIIRRKTLIVVHTNQLADQWEERFRFFCPNMKIGRVQGPIATVEGCDVVICMLQTLSMKEGLEPSMFDDFGVMAIDECHLVCTETFSKLLTRWGVKLLFGLSATPTRKDKLESVLFAHLGGIIYSGTREKFPLRVVFKYPEVSGCKELMNPRTQKPDHVAMITSLVQDETRTALIAQCAIAHMASKVLVLSERRDHLDRIMQHIIEQNAEFANDVGLYRGQMKPKDLKDSENKSIILGTYSIASVGLDIKGLNTLIFATPRSDVVQASGRIQRDISPVFDKLIIDIYDKFSVFTCQYAKRLSFYRQSEFEIFGATKRTREPDCIPTTLKLDTSFQ